MKKSAAGSATRTGWRYRVFMMLALVSLVVSGTVASPSHDSAWAASYPSWNDVLKARNNVKAKEAAIANLQRLLTQLQAAVDTAEAEAQKRGEEFQKSVEAFDAQDLKTQEYQSQADAAQAQADESMKRAGQMAARLARTGGGDLTATLFFNGDDASNLLSQLGMASKISEQSQGVYGQALQLQNSAQALTDQATLARAALEQLKIEKEKAQREAQAAADAAAAAYAEKVKYNATLQAQLATLKSDRIHTESEYTKGVQAQWGAGGAVEISSQGWARPVAGHITSGYGYRVAPISGVNPYHSGIDIGAGCNTSIHAAQSGTVVYAGYYGTYGNFVIIDHGGGISTAYAHIVNGGILVSYGQAVTVGQTIARVGSTGASTGCHLHFEVRLGSSRTNPQPFMAARGISIT